MQYLEINDEGVAVRGVYDLVEGDTLPANWKPITPDSREGFGYIWSEESQTWSAPLVSIEDLRDQRDALISATDWWAVQDRVMTTEQLDYRAALRDITEDYTPVEEPTWPSHPAETN
tara:strand:+ start:731 stop:1081 length:351 start_codon:yes stop_codon:yes gene_type:complete